MEQSIGPTVRAWREYRGIAQSALADAVHIRQGSLSRLEKGEFKDHRVSTLVLIAKTLGLTVDRILRGELPPKSPKPRKCSGGEAGR